MKIKTILHDLGILNLFLVLALLLPLLISFLYQEDDFISFLITFAVSSGLGLLLIFIFKAEPELRIKDSFTLVTMGWLSFTLLGALPFYFSGYFPSFTDAFFESMSGFTTTGASILRDVEKLPHGLLWWRSFTHWLGGMGIIVLSLAIFPVVGMGAVKLFQAESPGPEFDKLRPRIKESAKILWGVYLLITLLEVILLVLAGMNVFDSFCHTFGTMGTGGFSTKNASIAFYQNAWVDYIIVFFMILAGMNFSLHYQALKGRVGAYWRSSELLFFLALIGISSVLIGLDIYFYNGYPLAGVVQKSLFQTVSIITTTGFVTADYEQWRASTQIILLLLMFLGGCAGSTGGAIKIIRILVLVKFGWNEIKRLIHPQAVLPVRIDHRSVPQDIVNNIFSFFLLYLGIFALAVILMSLLGLDMVSAIGSVAATMGNIGPGLGSVGPVDNYAHIPMAGKWLLSFLMLIGRLEIYPVIILLIPLFWKK